MHKVVAFVVCLVCFSGYALADEDIPGATSEPDKGVWELFGKTIGDRPDSNWQMTHTPQLKTTVGEMYDAGTSLRTARNDFTWSAVTAAAGSVMSLVSATTYDPQRSRQSDGYYVSSVLAGGLACTALVCSLIAWHRIGQAGDHLHRAALGESRKNASGGTTRPQPDK